MKKNKWVPLLGIAALLSVNGACCKSKSPRIDVKKYTESAARQTAGLYDKLMATGERKSPQNFQNGVTALTKGGSAVSSPVRCGFCTS